MSHVPGFTVPREAGVKEAEPLLAVPVRSQKIAAKAANASFTENGAVQIPRASHAYLDATAESYISDICR